MLPVGLQSLSMVQFLVQDNDVVQVQMHQIHMEKPGHVAECMGVLAIEMKTWDWVLHSNVLAY